MGSRAVAVALLLAAGLIGADESFAARARSAEVSPPTVEGSLYKGATLRCAVPSADGPATVVWLRDEAAIAGATDETYVVVGADVGHGLACTATWMQEGTQRTATSAAVEIVVVTTAVDDRSRHVQRGPTLRLQGQVSSEGPTAAGQVLLIAIGARRDVVVARASVDEEGRYALARTIRGLVPGRVPFRIDFVPADPELHGGAQLEVTLKALSPLTYPFARVAGDRRVTFADGLVPFWNDGSACAVGCRPAGVINGWPLKPFHEQHPLRSALNERRLSGFHVGIDIMTTFPQAIYAIQSGYAHVLHAGDSAARVRVGNYIYWHVNLRVHEGQYVHAYDTILGYSLRWMRHLHLSEVAGSDSSYLNPLRPGGRALQPWFDYEPPVIGRPSIASDGSAVVEAFDPQSFVPKIYYETPVLAPAAVAYRVFDAKGAAITGLEWALRGSHWIPNALASTVFTPSAHSPGFFCFARNVICKPRWSYRLAGGLAPRLPLYAMHGRVRLTVYAWDWAGNITARDTWLNR
jgi:hypothetical protein